MNRKKWCAVFVAGCAAGLMVAICTSVWMERPGAAGGEVLILPLIGLLLYVGYEFGRLDNGTGRAAAAAQAQGWATVSGEIENRITGGQQAPP